VGDPAAGCFLDLDDATLDLERVVDVVRGGGLLSTRLVGGLGMVRSWVDSRSSDYLQKDAGRRRDMLTIGIPSSHTRYHAV